MSSTATATRYRVTLSYDHHGDCPCHTWDSIYQLVDGIDGMRHSLDARGYQSISGAEFNDATIAYMLNLYRHSGTYYYIAGGVMRGAVDPGGWDTARGAAVLIVKPQFLDEWQAMTDEQRESNAVAFMHEFNAWANGEIYGYTVEALEVCNLGHEHVAATISDDGLDHASCFGFYGTDAERSGLLTELAYEFDEGITAEQIQITGEADYLVTADQLVAERHKGATNERET